MSYRLDESTGILWRVYRDTLLPCVPESKVLSVLRAEHDEGAAIFVMGPLSYGVRKRREIWEFQSPGFRIQDFVNPEGKAVANE